MDVIASPSIRPLADALDAALPQTQCRRCGHDGCRPYADAMAQGEPINRCPPGGDALIATLAALTGRPLLALDRARGARQPPAVAVIDEARCIGCTLCIDACPVDAIVGAAKRMHTVIAAFCSGCDLCIAPCPVDCIALVPSGREWTGDDARAARLRFDARARRRAATRDAADAAFRRAAVAAALARARARRVPPPEPRA